MKKYCYEYPRPAVTVDIIIFSIIDKSLKVLLIKRKQEPFKDYWAIPGGFVRINESLEEAAMRELREETGVTNAYLEQLYTFGDIDRDPRGRVITVAYFALINPNNLSLRAATDAIDVKWFPVKNLPRLAFDHRKIINYALKRLRWKLEYTTIAFSVLPKKFTLREIQEVYEIIFDKKFDKRNFRKKLLSLGIIKKINERERNVSHRPAQLYTFKGKLGEIVEIL